MRAAEQPGQEDARGGAGGAAPLEPVRGGHRVHRGVHATAQGPVAGVCICWGARRVCRMRLWTACLLRSAIVGSAGRGAGGGRGGGCGAFERVPRPRSFVGVPPRSRETKSNRSPYP